MNSPVCCIPALYKNCIQAPLKLNYYDILLFYWSNAVLSNLLLLLTFFVLSLLSSFSLFTSSLLLHAFLFMTCLFHLPPLNSSTSFSVLLSSFHFFPLLSSSLQQNVNNPECSLVPSKAHQPV